MLMRFKKVIIGVIGFMRFLLIFIPGIEEGGMEHTLTLFEFTSTQFPINGIYDLFGLHKLALIPWVNFPRNEGLPKISQLLVP